MVPKDSAIAQVMGVTNAVTIDADGIAPITLVGPGAGGAATASAVVADIGDIARGVRTAPFGRPRGEAHDQQQGADAAPRGRLLHPPAGRGQAGHRRDHRQAPRRPGNFARIRSCSAIRRATQGGDDPKSRMRPVPVILITYATTEDAVRNALDRGRGDKVICGRAASDPDRKKLRPARPAARGDYMSTITVQPHQVLERILTLEIVRVTERAAVSAARLRGRGKEKAADQAAVDAMRRELNKLPIGGTVVIGEGERDEAPMLFIGEKSAPRPDPRSISPSIRSKARRCAPRTCRARSRRWRWRRAARCCTRRTFTWRRSRSAPAIRRASSISTRRRKKTSSRSPKPRA